MAPAMSKHERVMASVRGEQTDRPPWSLWRHFYDAEYSAEDLARSMLGWAQRYDFDFLKVNPRAEYHAQVWGATHRPSSDPNRRAERLDYPIKTPEDWVRLEPRTLDAPALAEQLRALRLIGDGLGGEVPYLQTVFTPLAIAGLLVEEERTLVTHLREAPDLVRHGLEVIVQTFVPYAAACLEAGASGLFYATTRWASRDYLTPAEYAEFGRPYDLRVLEAVREAPFNVLHVCDPNNILLDLADYPVQGWNWAATDPSNPSLADAAGLPGLRIGGLSREALAADDPSTAAREAEAARALAGERRWALGPNCSIPTTARDENIRAAGRVVGVKV